MEKVITKVRVHEITELQGYDSKTAKYVPAKRFKMQIVGYAGQETEENKFYNHISGGTNVELQTINKDVFPFFEVGKEYFIEFKPAPLPEEKQA